MKYTQITLVVFSSILCSSAFGLINHQSCKKRSAKESVTINIKNKYATITQVKNSKIKSPTYYKLTGRVGLSSEPRETPKYHCQGSRGEIKIFDRYAKVGNKFFSLKKIGTKATKKKYKKKAIKKYAALSRPQMSDAITRVSRPKIKSKKVYRGKSSCSQTWNNYDDIDDFTINIFQKNGLLVVKQSAPTAIFSPEKFKVGGQIAFKDLPEDMPVYTCSNSRGVVKIWDEHVYINKKAYVAKLVQ